ncbi:ABC transporter ATP-binding protein [Caldilinea sp.]|uniref:ABC transporter ATP-binding protein n=1 Tax=Caldilinea sp. TaxID=2293560 RepID=UPI002BCC5463|nr:ABC transporter ATP-binding protein [Anaerolineales bacterium]HQY91052.1 ABC transporter ATP-binding protein [Caldilinea sp.]
MLSISDLTAGYGKLMILHDVALNAAAGQFVAILGPNGSGKSTLLKTIVGLTTLERGVIRFDGQAIEDRRTETIRSLGLSYVPQRENVFKSMNVRENLLLAVRDLAKPAAAAALDECYVLFPILHDRQSQRAGSLSGGERQMLAIALGWLARPKLMLLDEPSAGLSPLFVTEVFRTLRALRDAGITLVVVEQNARSVLRWCDYAYLLRDGQVAFQGSAADLLADEETVKSYLGVAITRKDAVPI